jgi:hypothetical protein
VSTGGVFDYADDYVGGSRADWVFVGRFPREFFLKLLNQHHFLPLEGHIIVGA